MVWIIPSEESYKLNVDTSRFERRNQGTIGGVRRDNGGKIEIAFELGQLVIIMWQSVWQFVMQLELHKIGGIAQT